METTRIRRKLQGDRNQCPSCQKFFNSTHAFSKHLTGQVATLERRCMTEEEMLNIGMALNKNDYWVGSVMNEDLVQKYFE